MTTEQKQTLHELRENFADIIFKKTGIKGRVVFYPDTEVKKPPISPEVVTDIVCRCLNVNYEDVFNQTRKREIVEARHIAMYLVYTFSELSLKHTGRFFNRDHSTVLHAKRVIGGFIQMDIDFRRKFSDIETEVIIMQETFNN